MIHFFNSFACKSQELHTMANTKNRTPLSGKHLRSRAHPGVFEYGFYNPRVLKRLRPTWLPLCMSGSSWSKWLMYISECDVAVIDDLTTY